MQFLFFNEKFGAVWSSLVFLAPWTQAQQEVEADGGSVTMDGDKPLHPTSSHHSVEHENGERLRSMGLWFFCFWDLMERTGSFPLASPFGQNPQSRKDQEEIILLKQSLH